MPKRSDKEEVPTSIDMTTKENSKTLCSIDSSLQEISKNMQEMNNKLSIIIDTCGNSNSLNTLTLALNALPNAINTIPNAINTLITKIKSPEIETPKTKAPKTKALKTKAPIIDHINGNIENNLDNNSDSNDGNDSDEKDELINECENRISKYWKATQTKRKISFEKYLRNLRLCETLNDMKNSNENFIPKRLEPKKIEGEPSDQFKLRLEQASQNLDTEIKLLNMRSKEHEKKISELDSELNNKIIKLITKPQNQETLVQKWINENNIFEESILNKWESKKQWYINKFETEDVTNVALTTTPNEYSNNSQQGQTQQKNNQMKDFNQRTNNNQRNYRSQNSYSYNENYRAPTNNDSNDFLYQGHYRKSQPYLNQQSSWNNWRYHPKYPRQHQWYPRQTKPSQWNQY